MEKVNLSLMKKLMLPLTSHDDAYYLCKYCDE